MLLKSRLAGTKNYGAILRHFILDDTGERAMMIFDDIVCRFSNNRYGKIHVIACYQNDPKNKRH
jgi:hypothetical protein